MDLNLLEILLTAGVGAGLGWATYYVLMRWAASSNLQRLAMQGMLDGVILLSPGGRVIEINDAALEILGLPRAAVEGKKISRINHLEKFKNIMESREDIQIGENWYEFRISPLYLDKKRFFGQAVLIHNINHRKQAEQTRQEFLNAIRSLQEIHLELSEVEGLDLLYIRMVELARNRLNLKRIRLFLLNVEANTLVGTYGLDHEGNIQNEKHYSEKVREGHWSLEVFNSPGRTEVWDDIEIFDNGNMVGKSWKAATALWNGQRVLGYLVCDGFLSQQSMRPYMRELLLVLGNIYGHLIESKNTEKKIKVLNQRLEYMAMTDSLTGLYNRRYFIIHGNDEFLRCKRHNIPLSIVMFDIDHFKSVNDTFGHENGDMALIHVANIVKKNLREIDVLCRTGGEEFSVLALNTDLKDAVMLAERLRKTVEKDSQTLLPGRGLTISMGVAAFDPAMQSLDELLKNADVALYSAKSSGRNCVKSHEN